ncbi:MAG: hypothetical protein QOI95_4203 [Acidimicrobiaceae bacterium]
MGSESPDVLVGRDVELGALIELIDSARRGLGGLAVIEGEAGIGKTLLLARSISHARELGFETRLGTAEELTQDRPFGPILDALGADVAAHAENLDEVVGGLASLLQLTAASRRARVVDLIRTAAFDLAAQHPVLLAIDDVHWADQSTFSALRDLQMRASDVALLVLVATRPTLTDSARRGLDALVAAGALAMELRPLDDATSNALVAQLLGAAPGPQLSRLAKRAGGNPLYLKELVLGLDDEGLIERIGGIVDTGSDVLPRSLAEQVRRRVNELSRDARGLVRLGAVLGPIFSISEMVAASGRDATALLDTVDEVLRSGLFVEGGRGLAFGHDLVRRVVYDQIPAAARSSVHRQVAEALAASGASSLRVASHYALVAELGDERAIEWLHRAARETIAASPENAVNLLDQALALEPGDPDQRATLCTLRVEALAGAGRLDEAETVATQLAHDARNPVQIAAVQRLHAATLLLRNRGADAATLLEAIAATTDPENRGLSLAEAALSALVAGDPERARRDAHAVLHQDDGTAAGSGQSLALSVLSRLASLELRLDESLALARRAVEAGSRSVGGHRYQPLLFEALTLHDMDRLDEVTGRVELGRILARQHGETYVLPLYDGMSAFNALRAGRLGDAETEAAAGVRWCDTTGSSLASAWCHALLALTRLHRGDVDHAADATAAGRIALSSTPPLLGLDLMLLADALVHEARGDVDAAIDGLLDAWTLFTALGAKTMTSVVGPDLVRMAVAQGRAEAATQVTEALEHVAAHGGLTSWHGAALEARALVEDDAALAVRAADAYRESPRRLDAARATVHAGSALCRHGRETEGRALLHEALVLYEQIGAHRGRARAASELRAAGGRVPRPAAVEAGGGELLSPSERRVVELVVLGLGNQEIADQLFISRRTVETHLRRVFPKLGVSSRTQLAMWATQQGEGVVRR